MQQNPTHLSLPKIADRHAVGGGEQRRRHGAQRRRHHGVPQRRDEQGRAVDHHGGAAGADAGQPRELQLARWGKRKDKGLGTSAA